MNREQTSFNRAPFAEAQPCSILLVKLSAIGDVVHALPFLEVLRGQFPKARIDWLVEEPAYQVIQGHPALDRIIVSRRKEWGRRVRHPGHIVSVLKEARETARLLRETRYDWVIDLQGLLKSGLLVGLARGTRKVGMTGFREGASLFLKERPVPVSYEEHAIDRYLRVAAYLGCSWKRARGRVPVSKEDQETLTVWLQNEGPGDGPFVAIHPMAEWRTKLWFPDRFALLADRIAQAYPLRVLFTGAAGDRDIIESIMGNMKEKAINLAGRTTLQQLACLYERSRLVITTDTGPMHIAAAMGVPVVALFGPTAPWRTGPYGPGHVVVRSEVSCSPCFLKKCDHLACMKGITVDQAFQGVSRIYLNQ